MLILFLISHVSGTADVPSALQPACAGSEVKVNTEEFRVYDEGVVLPQVIYLLFFFLHSVFSPFLFLTFFSF